MIKTIFLTALTLTIAVAGGAGSVWLALDADFSADTVATGPWRAHPLRGTADADPYSRARFSRQADLALGIGEGLLFAAAEDSDGQRLRTACRYRLEGQMPPARFWTLHARDSEGAVIARQGARAPAIHSFAVLREEDNSVRVAISKVPAPGNWLALGGDGGFALTMIFYDTALASSALVAEIDLPRILREGCDD